MSILSKQISAFVDKEKRKSFQDPHGNQENVRSTFTSIPPDTEEKYPEKIRAVGAPGKFAISSKARSKIDNHTKWPQGTLPKFQFESVKEYNDRLLDTVNQVRLNRKAAKRRKEKYLEACKRERKQPKIAMLEKFEQAINL